ncbi:MAG: hypothetical protein ACJAT2_000521 [Bacteriovoracaceae bacterium]|jgi:hypothetical protein
MNNSSLVLLGLLLSAQAFGATLIGSLSESEKGEVILSSLEKGGPISRVLLMDDKFKYTLDSKMLNSPGYLLQFEGEIEGDHFITSKTPTIVAGDMKLIGLLKRSPEGELSINGTRVTYGRTKPIYGIPFDETSKGSFVDKEVEAQGQIINGVFVINAIIEKDLLSVKGPDNYPAPASFKADPLNFILKEMPKNINSQRVNPFSGIVYNKKGYTPTPGEGVLIITLSGRQGDSPGASAGHFAIGGGVVAEDLSIKGETYNFYFEGPKEVLAGNTDLVSYFGHLIQGQQNYRPTFTLYAYGVSKEDLRKVRDLYERELHKVRTVKGLEITPGYNCTTTSNYVLREIGIHGAHHNLGNRMLDFQNVGYINPLSWWANNTSGEGTVGGLRVLSYVSTRDPEHYVPRATLESFAKNFSNKRWNKRKGIKRVDYVFIPQTPSRRQVGGMSYDSPIKEGKRIVDYSNERGERIEPIIKAHEVILNKENYSEAEVLEAQKIIDADQAEVKAILDTID